MVRRISTQKDFDDLINAIVSWIPERFVPFEIPETVWRYNTNIYHTGGSGTSPSALVSTGIYEIGLLGALIHPFIWDWLPDIQIRGLRGARRHNMEMCIMEFVLDCLSNGKPQSDFYVCG